MHYIKMGKRYVNMDAVTEIEYIPANKYNGERYQLYQNYVFDDGVAYIVIDGGDLVALEMWLEDNSTDIRAPMLTEE